MEWLNNPWLVGVGGGVLSGLLVTLISRALLSRRDDREYCQNLVAANREVLYALRPGISEGHIPERHVVEALISATGRKYSVGRADMHDVIVVGEELTKEIMDSSFISAATKREYCNQLESLRPRKPTPTTIDIDLTDFDLEVLKEVRVSTEAAKEYRVRSINRASEVLGLATGITSVALAFSQIAKVETFATRDFADLVIPAASALSAVTVAVAIRTLWSRASRSTNPRSRPDDTPQDPDA